MRDEDESRGGNTVTIRDVAKAADVSTATVSRTLDGSKTVSSAMHERVMAAVQKTGYRANPAARDLRKGRSASALLLVPNLANPFFSTIIEAIGKTLGEAGISVQVVDTWHGSLRLDGIGTDGRADGVICFDATIPADILTATRIPLVMACEWYETLSLTGCAVDNAQGARLSAEHLLGLGHRRLLHVAGSTGNVLTKARSEAFREAMLQAGADFEIWEADFTLESGADAAKRWSGYGSEERATGVFCASDECALGFIAKATALGFSVPRDVSVCGFDDIAVSAHFIPSLTTIHQPRLEIGNTVARSLLAMMNGGEPPSPCILPVDLVVRSSTAQAPR